MTSPQAQFSDVVCIRETALRGLRDFYLGSTVAEVRPPLLVDATGSCENADTLVSVTGASRATRSSTAADLFLSQTGQLFLETALMHCDACWCHTISFRDDEPDRRHLREFELVEEEFRHTSPQRAGAAGAQAVEFFNRLLDRIQDALRSAMSRVLETPTSASRLRNARHLEYALSTDFPRLTYDDALTLANAERSRLRKPPLSWGDDLSPADESVLLRECAHGAQPIPVFVTLFPKHIKFFNMKTDPRDSRRVLSADVLMPFSGETVGAAVREDDYDVLLDRLVTSPMFHMLESRRAATLETFTPYLQIISSGRTSPHAGYGIGLDRLIQFIMSSSDIRATSIAERLTTGS